MSSRLIYGYLIGALLLALLYFLAIPFYEKKIPTSLVKDVQKQLDTKGHIWAKASASGRDITLNGKAPTPRDFEDALTLTKGVSGVRSVENNLIHTLVRPYYLTAEWEDKQLTIKGYLPDEESLSRITKVFESQYPKGRVNHQLAVAKGAPEGWADLTLTALENTSPIDLVSLDLIGQHIDLSAKSTHSADINRLMSALRPFEKKGFTLKSNLVATDQTTQRCQTRFNKLLLHTQISFNTGKATINKESIPLLRKLGEIGLLCSEVSITIAGYTDNKGRPKKNLSLSQDRADTIARWLSNAGMDEKLLNPVGYGASDPIADNSTEKGRAKNRRIEFIVQEK
ncbi:OmpA family protein [Leucothrix arctica]|uniref:OmpA-like domain-containing protein n=1 Tax=Leucothrix arctica TaxID=1481894 RepID=A0A317CSF7_9GAMM|nr:OmpA family protein [Leucothrix arctica]PWQ99252.1 hypothetical protein DKT75_01520 [Leucothrix arctica]